MGYAEVAVDAPVGVGQTFSYAVPSWLDLKPGHAVLVPFGPRRLCGVVFSITRLPQVPNPREIEGCITTHPLLQPYQLQLAHWLSRYYRASLFECVALMLPPDFQSSQKAHLTVIPGVVLGSDSLPVDRKIFTYVQQKRKVQEIVARRLFGRGARGSIARLVARGKLLHTWDWLPPKVRPKQLEYLKLELAGYARTAVIHQLRHKRAHRQAGILDALASFDQPQPAIDLRRQFGATAVKSILTKGYASRHLVRQQRDPLAQESFLSETPYINTTEQARALETITNQLDGQRDSKPFLLWGVTGSGKTEVYLQAIAHCLAQGNQAVVLVPEISLTPQMVRQFAARFPGSVAVLHSGLSVGERFDQWWGIFQGHYSVVIGSRSAIFAPLTNLGLIVIDEEHEWTYKQQDRPPLYDARETAIQLARLTRSVVVLGSATPDVVSYDRSIRGSYRLLELPYRVGHGDGQTIPLAHVDVVDMRRELKEGNRSIFSRSLERTLNDCLVGGHQGILFLNRRGASGSGQCRSCGLTLRCQRCSVTLTYHSTLGLLVCHSCNRRLLVPSTCPRCTSQRIRFLGLGTERVVEELERRFPKARVLRWDKDAVTNLRAHQEMTRQFLGGTADFLVGTQMLAKGLHFPRVSVVGVILADLGLNVPDFRAGERVFQVLCQVAGRAGRGSSPGQVIVQTYNPDHYAIRHAASQNYQGFYKEEIGYRRQAVAPPFSQLVRLTYQDYDEEHCRSEALKLARSLRRVRDAMGEVVDIVGPAPAYLSRVRRRYRWQVILRGLQPSILLDDLELPRGWVVDIDPQTTA